MCKADLYICIYIYINNILHPLYIGSSIYIYVDTTDKDNNKRKTTKKQCHKQPTMLRLDSICNIYSVYLHIYIYIYVL